MRRDVDLAVKGKFKSALDLGKLVVMLEEELCVSADKIDIVDIDNVPLHLSKKIIDEAVIVCGDYGRVMKDLTNKYIDLLDKIDENLHIKKIIGKMRY